MKLATLPVTKLSAAVMATAAVVPPSSPPTSLIFGWILLVAQRLAFRRPSHT
jgi:hypothetical protein